MTNFNTQTNTCFTTGISPDTNDKSETKNTKGTYSPSYASNGVKPLITIGSKGSTHSTLSNNVDEDLSITSTNINPIFNSIIIPSSELENKKIYEVKTRVNSIYDISYSNYY